MSSDLLSMLNTLICLTDGQPEVKLSLLEPFQNKETYPEGSSPTETGPSFRSPSTRPSRELSSQPGFM